MIPLFPQTKKLELSDQEEIKGFIRAYPPYSDYNFVSMWSYDTNHLLELSRLNGNLVLKFQDYMDFSLFYTFLGNHKSLETIEILLDRAKKDNLDPVLKMVPHSSVNHLLIDPRFQFEEDIDNFDYIISARDFSQMEGSEYHKKRNMVSRFLREYGENHRIVLLDIAEKTVQVEIVRLFHHWVKIFGKDEKESEHELQAIYKLFEGIADFQLLTFGVEIKGKLVAFLISELIHDRYVVRHFEKPDVRYHGITEFLQRESASFFYQKGYEFINYEQDLGLMGLRNAKSLCHPSHFLKKYKIKKA